MTRRGGNRLAALLAGLVVLPALAAVEAPRAAPAERPEQVQPSGPGLGLGLGRSEPGKPLEIEAEQGIEWQQTSRVYIARGNATAKRGDVTVYGDTLTAHYRPTAKPGEAAASTPAKDDEPGGGTDIYEVDADGHVRIATPTQTVYGDHAVYDVDKALLVVTGTGLKLVTPRDTVTARDSLEWYDRTQLAVARGDAIALRDEKRLRGDVLTAQVGRDAQGAQHISRIDAKGDVVVSSADQVGRGDSGVYNVDTGIATLVGHVRLTRAENELRGQYGVVDLNNHVSRLLSAPPSAKLTSGPPPRVEGLIVPRQKPAAPQPPN